MMYLAQIVIHVAVAVDVTYRETHTVAKVTKSGRFSDIHTPAAGLSSREPVQRVLGGVGIAKPERTSVQIHVEITVVVKVQDCAVGAFDLAVLLGNWGP